MSFVFLSLVPVYFLAVVLLGSIVHVTRRNRAIYRAVDGLRELLAREPPVTSTGYQWRDLVNGVTDLRSTNQQVSLVHAPLFTLSTHAGGR